MPRSKLAKRLKLLKRDLVIKSILLPLLGTKEAENCIDAICKSLAGLDTEHVIKREVKRMYSQLNDQQHMQKFPSGKIERRYTYRKQYNRSARDPIRHQKPTKL